MTRNSFCKISSTIIVLLVLSACASTQSRFPDYSETAKNQSSFTAIVDLFVYRDIEGQSRGYNEKKNLDSLNDAIAGLNNILAERAFSVEVLTELNGLTYEEADGIDYVISENWKSTGVPYKGLILDEDDNAWLTNSTKDFLSNLVEVAKEINHSKNRDQVYAENKVREGSDQETLSRISEMELNPSLFTGIESDVVLFVKVDGRFQKLGKYLAKGLLVGMTTSVLTGGIVAIPPGSYARTSIVAFDVKTKEILWHNDSLAEGKNAVTNSIKSALSNYPYSDGETPWDKRRQRARER